MSIFKKLFGIGSDETKKEEAKVNHFTTSVEDSYQEEEEDLDEMEELDEEPEEELSEEDKKMIERDRRMQEVLQQPTYHVFDDHDNSPQGQKAIQQGIKNKQNGRQSYDYTKAAGADFSWPDYDPAQIGNLEPWLCYGAGEDSGWIDLNEFPNGAERRAKAAYQTLGYMEDNNPKFMYVENKSIAELDRLLKLDDSALAAEAAQEGMKSNSMYSYRDYITGMKLDYKKRLDKNNGKVQEMLDVSNQMMQEEMNANIESAKSSGLLDPIKNITMEDWAAANAKIAGGMPFDEILKILGVEKPVWDEVSAEWMARMSQDTTFAITKVYGDAFTNSNMGKFANVGTASTSAGTENAAMEAIKNDLDLYVKITCHQGSASTQGIDANMILQQYGISAADWGMIGMHWSTKISSDFTLGVTMGELMDKYNAEFATTAAPKAGDDIDF